MSQTVLEFNVQPLKRSLAREAATLRTLCDNYEACHENIREIAESAGDGEQVDGCKTALREILALQAEAKAYAGALDGLSQSYQPALDDTKFAEEIERRKQLIEQQNPYAAAGDPVYTAFVRDLEERGAGGAEPAGDEDVAVVNTQQQFAKNAACPLTGRPVLELAEPVEDEQGYVYEKFAILQHITNTARYPGGAVACPMAATNHMVRKDKLRRAHRVVKEQKRRMHGGGTQGVSNDAENVIDV